MMDYDNDNELTPQTRALVQEFVSEAQRAQPRVVRRWTYRDYIAAALRSRLARMFDLEPILGNLVTVGLLVAAILAYRLDAGLFPDIGRWEPYLLGAFAAVAGWQTLKASFRSFLAPILAAIAAGVGLIATQGDVLLLTFATPVYQWIALGALVGILCAAFSGRE